MKYSQKYMNMQLKKDRFHLWLRNLKHSNKKSINTCSDQLSRVLKSVINSK